MNEPQNLNALRRKLKKKLQEKLEYLDFVVGDATTPFGREGVIHFPVKIPNPQTGTVAEISANQIVEVYVEPDYVNYNYIALKIHDTKEAGRLDFPDKVKPQEAPNGGE